MKAKARNIILIIFLCKNISFAQNCEAPYASKFLEGNNISALIKPTGNLFWDLHEGGFIVPNNQSPNRSTIFTAGIFLGALDNQGNVKVSFTSIPNGNSYIPGPLNGNIEDL